MRKFGLFFTNLSLLTKPPVIEIEKPEGGARAGIESLSHWTSLDFGFLGT